MLIHRFVAHWSVSGGGTDLWRRRRTWIARRRGRQRWRRRTVERFPRRRARLPWSTPAVSRSCRQEAGHVRPTSTEHCALEPESSSPSSSAATCDPRRKTLHHRAPIIIIIQPDVHGREGHRVQTVTNISAVTVLGGLYPHKK